METQNLISAQTTVGQWAMIHLAQCAVLISRRNEIPELSQFSLRF